MDNIKISVVVAVYNIEDYICHCLDSIIKQTYQPFEIILVDDGSTDKSGKICDEYSKNNFLIRVIHKKNAGLSVARNTGIKESKGDYIYFIDGDDWIEPFSIESFVNILSKYGKCDYIHWRMKIVSHIDGSQRVDDCYIDNKWAYGKTGMEVFAEHIRRNHEIRLGIKGLYSRDFLIENSLYNVPGLYSEDQEFTPRVFYHAQKVLGNDFPGYCYRENRPGSLVNTLNLKKGEMLVSIYRGWADWIEKENSNDKTGFFQCLHSS